MISVPTELSRRFLQKSESESDKKKGRNSKKKKRDLGILCARRFLVNDKGKSDEKRQRNKKGDQTCFLASSSSPADDSPVDDKVSEGTIDFDRCIFVFLPLSVIESVVYRLDRHTHVLEGHLRGAPPSTPQLWLRVAVGRHRIKDSHLFRSC